MSEIAVAVTALPPSLPIVARRRPTGIDLIDEAIKARLPKPTDISWAHMTFNCWAGCSRVSDACTNCYAETMSHRFAWGKVDGVNIWGKDAPRHLMSDGYWKQPAAWNRLAAKLGVRLRVFCASLADVFEDRDDLNGERARLWALIAATPNLDWLLLTKRPENIARMVPPAWMVGAWPINCWMGATMENQRYANLRTRHLRRIPAPVIFASGAPLVGPVVYDLDVIDWVILEGESGRDARPAHPDWFRAARDQCVAAGIPFHVKQRGEFSEFPAGWPDTPGCLSDRSKAYAVAADGQHWPEQELAIRYLPGEEDRPPGDRMFEHIHETGRRMYRGDFGRPSDLRLHAMHRVGTKKAGRLLDGREWMQVPVSPALEAA
jgi:protein gp37